MKIIYVTDLHGCEWKYARTFDAAARVGAYAVVNGGDMYPKNIDLTRQHEFVEGYLDLHLTRYDEAGIAFLCMPGNDDLAAFDPLLERVLGRHPAARLIARRRVELGEYDVIGLDLVTDYPFRLKDRCRFDDDGSRLGPQLGTGLLSRAPGEKGVRNLLPGRPYGCFAQKVPDTFFPRAYLTEIADWEAHARSLPTMRAELLSLPEPRDPARAVYVIHDPPAGLGLDVCGGGREVGSRSVREFILERRPPLALHGHIHESPRETGVWRARLPPTPGVKTTEKGVRNLLPGRPFGCFAQKVPDTFFPVVTSGRRWGVRETTCVQPGQLTKLSYVVIDLDSTKGVMRSIERVEE